MMQFGPGPARGGIPMKTTLLFRRLWSGNRRVNRCSLPQEPIFPAQPIHPPPPV
jgi:hypothetical protein